MYRGEKIFDKNYLMSILRKNYLKSSMQCYFDIQEMRSLFPLATFCI